MSRAPMFSCAAMLFIAFAVSPVVYAACPDFAAPVGFSTGTSPRFAAAADFNRDGIADLAIAASGSNAVSILLGNPSGSFDAGTSVPAGASPRTVLAVDVNRDGNPDLAIGDDTHLRIVTGDGFGGFGSPTTYAAPFARPVVAADFDRNGTVDLAVANLNASTVSIFLGNGFGGFTNSATLSAAASPTHAAAGDFNRDGAIDLAVANRDADSVTLHDGNGDGTFDTARSLAVPAVSPAVNSGPTSVVAADFDEDGRLDLAVSSFVSNRIAVFAGDGTGSFGAATQLTPGVGPTSVAAGDFNADGSIDLASANGTADSISILTGNGAGGFAAAATYPAGDLPSWLVAEDFDGDGKVDLVSANLAGNNISLLANSGACLANCGTFAAATTFGSSATASSVAAGDFDGDGALDLAVANQSSGNVSIALGDAAGGFGSTTNFSAGTAPSGVVVVDVNRDGLADLAVSNEGSSDVSILLGNGAGSFGSPTSFGIGIGTPSPKGIVAGDFDLDGAMDLAVTCGGSKELVILENNTTPGSGSPNFSSVSISSVGTGDGPRGVAAGDINGDGVPDLLVANSGDGISAGSVLLFLGNGSGGFSSSGSLTASIGTTSVAVGDFDGDGDLDLAAANRESGNVAIGLGNGSGNFGSPSMVSVSANPVSIAVADVDLDGDLDLAVANSGASNVSILLGNGSGSFSSASPSTHAVGTTPAGLIAADFDGNGKPDLAAATDNSSGNLSVLLNSCPPPELTIDKSHFGSFNQGGTGAYSIAVSNLAAAASAGTVTVTDTLPTGLTATSISGSGWDCTLSPLACSRSDSLGGTDTWPQISISVNVASNAPAAVVNTATLDGGADVTPANNMDSDPTTIALYPDLTIAKSHTGNFAQGQNGAIYTIVVSNGGGASALGTITVTDTLPSGLTATAMGGTGWNCTLGTLTCSRNDALAPGASYPAIALTVNVSSTAATPRTNVASVSGGGEFVTSNNTASDPTTVVATPDLTIAKTHSGSFSQGQSGAVYTIVVTNSGGAATSGTITVSDTLPAGLTASSMSGTGWSCTLGTLTCTRSDALASLAAHPPITLTVNVAANATSPLVNNAAVSGGGEAGTANNTASDSTIVKSVRTNCGRFAPQITIAAATSGAPRGVAIADYNGDGDEDLAYTDGANDLLGIMLGNGDGTFGPITTMAAVNEPNSPVTGDFDHDGAIDIAFVNIGSTKVSVYLGNGDGTFAARVDYTVGSVPYTVATGFFDADADLDLAVANQSTFTVSILLGNGDGTFATAVDYATANFPTLVGVGDFNGDAKADLAVGGLFALSFLPGAGDGTFGARTDFMIGGDARAIVVEDFNEDSKLDVAVAHLGDANVSVYIGNGAGSFAPRVNYPSGTGTFWMDSDDLDGDGNVDLAVAHVGGAAVLLGNGDGTFAAAVTEPAGTDPDGLAIADINGDSRPDLVVANGTSQNLSLIFNACTDLTIAKSHSGNFTQGQTGAAWSIVVKSSDLIAGSGTVTVTEALPAGVVAASISGSGWNCTLATLSCTRSDALAAGASYPPIVVTANVNSNAAATITNTATVAGGGDEVVSNNSASDPTTVNAAPLIAATRFAAAAVSTSQINLSWDGVTTAVSYQVFRRSLGGPFVQIATPTATTFSDTGRTAGLTYVYQVKAVNNVAATGPATPNDLATTFIFTDDPLVPAIKAVHFTQLRTAIDAVRAAAGLGAAPYTNAIVAGSLVKAVDLTEMRTALNAARTQLSVPALNYTDPSVTAATRIKAAHIQELRSGTK
jgi:uncharacterized repeat protein (TIGR01451 family)